MNNLNYKTKKNNFYHISYLKFSNCPLRLMLPRGRHRRERVGQQLVHSEDRMSVDAKKHPEVLDEKVDLPCHPTAIP